jgi:nucleoside-diphosphate-sugar epimerase
MCGESIQAQYSVRAAALLTNGSGHAGMGAMVVILGLGFTGARLARRLLWRGVPVSALVRGVERFVEMADSGVQLTELTGNARLPGNATVAHLIPPLPGPENSALRATILKLAPKRVVYVSSTGVYGERTDVDWETPATPNDDRGRARIEEERWIASGPWTSLILRSAAIYGPGRGVHAAVRVGKMPRGAGSGITSRIHVDDLAAIVEAGLFADGDVQGAWPVADDAPCATAEIVRWCAELMRLEAVSQDENGGGPVSGRNVDGRKIREILGVELKYPSWQTGIAACLAEER